MVSVNPYRQMDIYGKDSVDAYRGRELYENPPHLYAVSDAAYKAMKRRAKDTCIVISGASNPLSQRGKHNTKISYMDIDIKHQILDGFFDVFGV